MNLKINVSFNPTAKLSKQPTKTTFFDIHLMSPRKKVFPPSTSKQFQLNCPNNYKKNFLSNWIIIEKQQLIYTKPAKTQHKKIKRKKTLKTTIWQVDMLFIFYIQMKFITLLLIFNRFVVKSYLGAFLTSESAFFMFVWCV